MTDTGSADDKISREFAAEQKALLNFIQRRVNDLDQAEVILQTSFERATRSLREKSVASIRALLYVIARNLITDHYRQKGFRSQFWSEDHDVEEDISEHSNPERQAMARERLSVAAEVINGLPEKCRYSFVEHRFKNRALDDIATELSLSKSMIKKYVQKAVLSIQDEIERRERS